MIWLAWRQFRGQAITAAAILAVLAILLAVTGPHLVSGYNYAGLNACHANCASAASNFGAWLKSHHNFTGLFYAGLAIMYLVPALIGVFWGAPLIASEVEARTQRIAWSQSVTRARWTAVKLGLVGLAAVATAGLLSLMISWWAAPIDHALTYGGQNVPITFSRLSPLVFAARGVAPIGYAAFAFALGVTVGVHLRRTLPAMAVTLVVFAAVQVLVPVFVRPNVIPPAHLTAPLNPGTNEMMITSPSNQMTLTGSDNFPGAWILSDQTITPAGRTFAGHATQACLGPNSQACTDWIASKHLRQLVTYQPASRFWPLQWIETASYLVLAAGLGWICAWQVRRKRL
jgi:hypothetical protein